MSVSIFTEFYRVFESTFSPFFLFWCRCFCFWNENGSRKWAAAASVASAAAAAAEAAAAAASNRNRTTRSGVASTSPSSDRTRCSSRCPNWSTPVWCVPSPSDRRLGRSNRIPLPSGAISRSVTRRRRRRRRWTSGCRGWRRRSGCRTSRRRCTAPVWWPSASTRRPPPSSSTAAPASTRPSASLLWLRCVHRRPIIELLARLSWAQLS